MCGPKFCSMHINRTVEEDYNQKITTDGKRSLNISSTRG